jgi:hypothetical protein
MNNVKILEDKFNSYPDQIYINNVPVSQAQTKTVNLAKEERILLY